jgi:3-dehydroshikimate dehydratase
VKPRRDARHSICFPQRTAWEDELSHARIVRAAILLAALPCAAAAQNAVAPTELLRVTRYADDANEGSLRYAIERSNRAPGRYRIEIEAVGSPPYVIKPNAPLPPVKGPAVIEGAAWKQSGDFIVLDGTGFIEEKGPQTCPGAVPGQFGANVRTTSYPGLALVDTQGVDISGLEVRNFCIGILIQRSSANVVHDNRIVANRGGAGVMLTGDDGAGNSTATTTLHNKVLRNEFLDNGDGAELTRGAAFNLIADNVFRSTAANPEPSQGIEILEGHDNVLVGNRFEGYSDGVQVNRGQRNYIANNVFTDNTLGLSLSGRDTMIERNIIYGNAVGIAVRPTATGTVMRLSRNSVYDNGRNIQRCFAGGSCDPNLRRGGIVLGTPGPEHARYVGPRGIGVVVAPENLAKICPDGAPACQAAPNFGIAPPTLDSVRRRGTDVVVLGHFEAKPDARFTVEVFANRQAGGTEGEIFMGDASAASDPKGRATFALTIPVTLHAAIPPSFTATVTSSEGATSEFSEPVALAE